MDIRFDFIIHWLWTIVFALLTLSGLAMVGAKYAWLLSYDIASADYVHRVLATVYIIITFILIAYEVMKGINNEDKKHSWFIFGKNGYQLFIFITTLIFIITGVIIWVCMDSNMAALSFNLFVHEKLTYLVVASLIWHVYVKGHALIMPKKVGNKKHVSNTTMIQKPWFKLFIWAVTTSFFFMASGIIISALGPEPFEEQVMRFMQGMMGAMHNSLMGLSMTIEQDTKLKDLIINASSITLPLMLISVIVGLYVRFLRRKGDAG